MPEKMGFSCGQIGNPEKIKALLRPDAGGDFGDGDLRRVPIELKILRDFKDVSEEQIPEA